MKLYIKSTSKICSNKILEEKLDHSVEFMNKQTQEKILKRETEKKANHSLQMSQEKDSLGNNIEMRKIDERDQNAILIKIALEAMAPYVMVVVILLSLAILAFKASPLLADFIHGLFSHIFLGDIKRQ